MPQVTCSRVGLVLVTASLIASLGGADSGSAGAAAHAFLPQTVLVQGSTMMTRTLLPAIRCERGDGSTMSLLAVLVGSDVLRSGRAQIGGHAEHPGGEQVRVRARLQNASLDL